MNNLLKGTWDFQGEPTSPVIQPKLQTTQPTIEQIKTIILNNLDIDDFDLDMNNTGEHGEHTIVNNEFDVQIDLTAHVWRAHVTTNDPCDYIPGDVLVLIDKIWDIDGEEIDYNASQLQEIEKAANKMINQ